MEDFQTHYLTSSLAQNIVVRTMKILPYNINVMNANGIILGSGDTSRLNQVHEGALAAISKGKTIEITKEDASQLEGTKPGVNLPFFFQGNIIGVIGITGDPNDVRYYGELVRMTAELILEQTYLLEEIRWDERFREDFVSRLIHGEIDNDYYLYEQANRLEIDLSIPRITIVILVKENKDIIQMIKGQLGKDDLYVISNPYLVILKKITKKGDEWNYDEILSRIDQWCNYQKDYYNLTMKVASGEYYPGVSGLHQSFIDAVETLQVGMKLYPERNIYPYQVYKLEVLLRKTIAHQNIENLKKPFQTLVQNDKKGELVKTIVAYIEGNQHVQQVSDQLYIHRNTLQYRLQSIKEVTGKDPRVTKDLFELYTSMLLFYLDK